MGKIGEVKESSGRNPIAFGIAICSILSGSGNQDHFLKQLKVYHKHVETIKLGIQKSYKILRKIREKTKNV